MRRTIDAVAARHESPVQTGAASAFAAAQYARCIELCDQNRDSDSAVVAAEAAFRRRDYEGAAARATAALAAATGVSRISALGVIACARGALGDFTRAYEALSEMDAARSAEAPRVVALQAEYDRALVAWMAGDYGTCEALLRECDYRGELQAKAQSDFLRSWVYAKRGRFVEQAVLLCQAIDALRECSTPDVGTLARAVHALSVIVREVHVPRAEREIAALVRDVQWTADVAYEHFHALRNLGWHHALRANYIAGIRNLDLAKRLANGEYEALISHLDHAQIARVAGEKFTLAAQLSQAAELLDRIAGEPHGDECLTFVVAAEVFAESDPRRSTNAIERFGFARRGIRKSFALADDARTEGMFRYALAVIAERDGRRKHASRHAQAAFDSFDSLGFAWRAARAALVLYRCSGDPTHLNSARELIRPYPRSFVADDMRRAAHCNGMSATLTSRQREVLDLLLQGLTVEQAAHELNASPNTIKVHKRHIYSALGVRNRMGLLRRTMAQATDATK